MPEERELEKQLKIAARTGEYLVGRREVLDGVKGSKLLVWSASANVPQKILDECKALSVPAVKFNGNPVELGHACGIPFRVSVFAVKATGDADLKAYSNSMDYLSLSKVTLPMAKEEEKVEPKKEEPKKETKPAEKKRKPKKAAPETEEKAEKPKTKTKKTTRKKSAEEKDE